MPATFDIESPNLIPLGTGPAGNALPPLSADPSIQQDLVAMIAIRDTALRAYLKALTAGKKYEVAGMGVLRYDLAALYKAYIDARDLVNSILRHGNTSSMRYTRIIPLDR